MGLGCVEKGAGAVVSVTGLLCVLLRPAIPVQESKVRLPHARFDLRPFPLRPWRWAGVVRARRALLDCDGVAGLGELAYIGSGWSKDVWAATPSTGGPRLALKVQFPSHWMSWRKGEPWCRW